MQDHKQIWEDNLDEEIQHWRRWLGSDDERLRKHRETKLDPHRRIPNCFKGLTRLVDVGCGPLPRLGLFNNDGAPIDVVAVDPLARPYNELIDEFELIVNPRPIECSAEGLTNLLARNGMDGAFCHNALDHSFNPWLGYLEMVRVVRVGGVVDLVTCVNEGERNKYAGLHQWNSCLDDKRHLVLWRENERLDLFEELSGIVDFIEPRSHVNDQGVEVLDIAGRKVAGVDKDHWPRTAERALQSH